MRSLVWVFVVGGLFVAVGCSVIPEYAHDLPVSFRSVTYDASYFKTIGACRAALEEEGFSVSCADSASGIVFTEYRYISPESSEIGGKWRCMWFLRVINMNEKSMLTAEYSPEGDAGAAWWPMKIDRGRAMETYRSLFAEVQNQLELMSTQSD